MTLLSEREPLKVITKIADFKEEGLVSPEGRKGKKKNFEMRERQEH